MKAFEVAKGDDAPGTDGIWMWSELLEIPGNGEVDILLLDTEGLNSPIRSYDIDVKLFALSILLSSNFVYNQIGHISEQAIENLSMVLLLTNEIKFKSQNETG